MSTSPVSATPSKEYPVRRSHPPASVRLKATERARKTLPPRRPPQGKPTFSGWIVQTAAPHLVGAEGRPPVPTRMADWRTVSFHRSRKAAVARALSPTDGDLYTRVVRFEVESAYDYSKPRPKRRGVVDDLIDLI